MSYELLGLIGGFYYFQPCFSTLPCSAFEECQGNQPFIHSLHGFR